MMADQEQIRARRQLISAVKNVLWRAERGLEIKHLRWVALRESLDNFERDGKPIEISDPERSPNGVDE